MYSRAICWRAVCAAAAILSPVTCRAGSISYLQTNLVSDGAVPAAVTDPNLVNPWGISFGASTPFWVSDNGTGLSTLYRGDGSIAPLVVTIPPPGGSPAGTLATPTGTVFNANAASGSFDGDRFLFATEDGTISGWQGGTAALLRVDQSGQGSVYKGLATDGSRLYATDFVNGKVDVFDSSYNTVSLGAGAFTDPNLPSGFAPFGITANGGAIYVTYAERSGIDDVAGPGLGFVDKYNADGSLAQRLIVGNPGDPNSPLNSPWGMAWAPGTFGGFGGMLLVGNFGDGRINAFDPTTGAFAGGLEDPNGNPLVIDGLWGLAFGNSGPGFSKEKLYFTAGINGEADGLFGSVQPVPEPGTVALVCAGLAGVIAFRRRRANG